MPLDNIQKRPKRKLTNRGSVVLTLPHMRRLSQQVLKTNQIIENTFNVTLVYEEGSHWQLTKWFSAHLEPISKQLLVIYPPAKHIK